MKTFYQVTVHRLSDKDLSEEQVFGTIEEVNDFIKQRFSIESDITDFVVKEYKSTCKFIAQVEVLSKIRR